jgi:hypothetical protein
MTISIWVIIFILAAAGLILYYRKNKYKTDPEKVERTGKSKKYVLSDVDKMIDNLAKEESESPETGTDKVQEAEKTADEQPKANKNIPSDMKDYIQHSIILERRKKK